MHWSLIQVNPDAMIIIDKETIFLSPASIIFTL